MQSSNPSSRSNSAATNAAPHPQYKPADLKHDGALVLPVLLNDPSSPRQFVRLELCACPECKQLRVTDPSLRQRVSPAPQWLLRTLEC